MTRWEFLHNVGKLLVYAASLGINLICFTFYRSPAQQLIEYEAGRSRVKHGKHQDWKAIDFAIVEDINEDGVVDKDEIRWNMNPKYLLLGEYWESLGGTWGGRWKDPCDPYHFED